MSGAGRNAPCPCGSGSKAKRCCGAGPVERASVVVGMTGYVPTPDGSDGWSRANYRATGCPYGDVCDRGTEGTGACAAGCGV